MRPTITPSGHRLVPPDGARCFTWHNPGGVCVRGDEITEEIAWAADHGEPFGWTWGCLPDEAYPIPPKTHGGIVLVDSFPEDTLRGSGAYGGIAFCSPLDAFDANQGRFLALTRALHDYKGYGRLVDSPFDGSTQAAWLPCLRANLPVHYPHFFSDLLDKWERQQAEFADTHGERTTDA